MANVSANQIAGNYSNMDNELVNTTEALDSYNKGGYVMKFKNYGIRLINHNVQSLSNKLLDTHIMLTVDNLNVNILFY
jgi:hypothetical protein